MRLSAKLTEVRSQLTQTTANTKDRFLGLSKSARIVVTILAIAVLWMLTGIFGDGHKQIQSEKKFVKLKIVESVATERPLFILLNGVTKPEQGVVLRPEIDGAITKVIARDGDFLKAGQPIVTIDEENRRQLLAQAQSQMQSAKLQFQAAQKLFDKKLGSQTQLSDAKALLQSAEAGMSIAKSNLDKATIRAPFDGYVDLIRVKKGDYVSNVLQSVICEFTSTNKLKVSTFVSQVDVQNISEGLKAGVDLPNGIKREGVVTFVSKVADPSTRTFPVDIAVDNSDNLLRVGESVKVTLGVDGDVKLHKIPKSGIVLDLAGNIGVKVVDPDSRVLTKEIKIVDEDADAFWVSGLDEQERIIIFGAQYVQDGDPAL